MKTRQLIILSATVLVLAGAFGLSTWFAAQKEPPKKREAPVVKKYVRTRPVAYQDVQTDVTAYGRVQTAQSLDLLSEVAGRMYEGRVRLKEGVNFSKGDLLFYIDDREASLNLSAQKSNFLRDLAAILPDLKLDYPESYEVWQSYFNTINITGDLPSLPEVEDQKERTFIATKGIFSSYYAIKSAEARLDKYRYFAPWDGSITQVNMETGAFVNPGTQIGQIIRSGVYELKVAVETRDIPWIQPNAPARIFADETQQVWEGVVTRISDFVNQNTQSVDVFVAIRRGEQRIYDGQFLRASIPARIIKDGMIVPREAIYNGNEVFVLEDSFLRKEQVNIFRLGEETAVIGGLAVNDELVVEQLLNAHNNMKVFKMDERDIDLERKESRETQLAKSADDSNQGS